MRCRSCLHVGRGLHHEAVRDYWMLELDSNRRRKIVDIVKNNVVDVLIKLYPQKTVEKLRVYEVFAKVLEKLVAGHGEGLWNFFDTASKSRQQSFSHVLSGSRTTPHEQKCARRVVELCEDCLLVVYVCYIGYDHRRTARGPRLDAGHAHELLAGGGGEDELMVQLMQRSTSFGDAASDAPHKVWTGNPTDVGYSCLGKTILFACAY